MNTVLFLQLSLYRKRNKLPKELKASETISEIDPKKVKPKSSSFCVLYGLWKTHKKVLSRCLQFRPILSAIKSPS